MCIPSCVEMHQSSGELDGIQNQSRHGILGHQIRGNINELSKTSVLIIVIYTIKMAWQWATYGFKFL